MLVTEVTETELLIIGAGPCGLVAAIICNGRPTNAQHQQRFIALAEALYVDLGIVPEGAPGRELPEIKP